MSDPQVPPTEHAMPPGVPPARRTSSRRAPSVVIVNTGDGKGKSTAAFGVMVRAVARGWPVAVVQFLKSGKWNVGEEKIGRQLGVDWWAIGEGFTWDSTNLSEDQAVAAEAWAHARRLLGAGGHRLVILDEVTYPMNWGWIDVEDVCGAIRRRPAQVNVVATGRDAPPELLEIADTATEMRKLKHAYDEGILAQKGIEY